MSNLTENSQVSVINLSDPAISAGGLINYTKVRYFEPSFFYFMHTHSAVLVGPVEPRYPNGQRWDAFPW